MLKILAIGNSFSTDATAHLEKMTKGAHIRNLYIGGCSLERHANNLQCCATSYAFQRNGVSMLGEFVSANGVLRAVEWDIVTVQQASHFSGLYESYEPHLEIVLSYIRKLCPKAKVVWHQTWAYAQDSTHPGFANYERDQQKMFSMIEQCSHRAALENGLGLIESGKSIQLLREGLASDGTDFCRDGFHLSLDYGRYAAAYTWAKYFGLEVDPFYVPAGAKEERLAEIRAFLDAHI